MAKLGGTLLRLVQTLMYALCFFAAAIIIGIYSYFLAVQADRDRDIPSIQKAVEGIAGVAVVYSAVAAVLTCCLGGFALFAFLGIVLDLAFTGAFIAIAVLLRSGTDSCDGDTVTSPLGDGPPDSKSGYRGGGGNNVTYSVTLGFACRLNKACFVLAIIGALLFLLSALIQFFLGRHHQREKRYGPSPANNYTAGSGVRWFRRKRGPKTTHDAYGREEEIARSAAVGGLAAPPTEYRPSHDTAYTGTTMGSPTRGTFTGSKYDSPVTHHTNGGGYHTGPTGTEVNPYGYDNTRTAGTNF